jgi:hypothetical protein
MLPGDWEVLQDLVNGHAIFEVLENDRDGSPRALEVALLVRCRFCRSDTPTSRQRSAI